MSGAEANPAFGRALQAAARLHHLFLSTSAVAFLAGSDAALVIQQAREEMHPISSFCDDAEEKLERDGKVAWALKE